MLPLALVPLLIALGASAPTSKKLASPTATSGGTAAEPAAATRATPPAETRTVMRNVMLRVGEPLDVSPAERALLETLVAARRQGDEPGAEKAWTKVVAARWHRTSREDADALIAFVLQEAYLKESDALRTRTEELKEINEARTSLRRHIAEVRERIAARPGQVTRLSLKTVAVSVSQKQKQKQKRVLAGKTKTMSIAEWEAYAAHREADARALAELIQMMQLDLQDALQEQQQSYQMLSNLSKSMHDTAKTVIEKMKD